MPLVPVQGDPFSALAPSQSGDAAPAQTGSTGPTLKPVQGNPFGDANPFASAAPAAPVAQPAPVNWSDVPSQAVQNFLPSAQRDIPQIAGGIVQAVTNPVQTVKSFYDIGNGLVSKLEDVTGMQKPDDQREALVNQMGSAVADRYGSLDNLKQTLATDPFGAVLDLASVLSMATGAGEGIAAAKAGTAVGDVAQAAANVTRAVNPATYVGNLVSNVGAPVAKAAGNVAAYPFGLSTGAGLNNVTKAARYGAEGNQAFTGAMRGTTDVNAPVTMAQNAVAAAKADRAAAYNASAAGWKSSTTPLSFNDVNQAVAAAEASTKFGSGAVSSVTDPVAAKLVSDIKGDVQTWQANALVAPEFGTAEGLDQLKQTIFNHVGAVDPVRQPNAYRVGMNIYNAAKNTVAKQDPAYAKAMGDYSDASDTIKQITKTFSLNGNTDTALRKLQSLTRNNVSTNYGARMKLGDVLSKYEPTLMPTLTGQAMSSWAPRGLARIAASGEGIALPYLAVTNPAAAAAAVAGLGMSSPRLVGEGAYGVGRAIGSLPRGIAVPTTLGASQFGRIPSLAAPAPG